MLFGRPARRARKASGVNLSVTNRITPRAGNRVKNDVLSARRRFDAVNPNDRTLPPLIGSPASCQGGHHLLKC